MADFQEALQSRLELICSQEGHIDAEVSFIDDFTGQSYYKCKRCEFMIPISEVQ